jgi:hypothetical protein
MIGIYFVLGTVAFYMFSRRNTSGHFVFICAIAAMLCLAISELVMQIIATSVSWQMLSSAVQDLETNLLLEQQAALEYVYNRVVFVEELMLVGNKFVINVPRIEGKLTLAQRHRGWPLCSCLFLGSETTE